MDPAIVGPVASRTIEHNEPSKGDSFSVLLDAYRLVDPPKKYLALRRIAYLSIDDAVRIAEQSGEHEHILALYSDPELLQRNPLLRAGLAVSVNSIKATGEGQTFLDLTKQRIFESGKNTPASLAIPAYFASTFVGDGIPDPHLRKQLNFSNVHQRIRLMEARAREYKQSILNIPPDVQFAGKRSDCAILSVTVLRALGIPSGFAAGYYPDGTPHLVVYAYWPYKDSFIRVFLETSSFEGISDDATNTKWLVYSSTHKANISIILSLVKEVAQRDPATLYLKKQRKSFIPTEIQTESVASTKSPSLERPYHKGINNIGSLLLEHPAVYPELQANPHGMRWLRKFKEAISTLSPPEITSSEITRESIRNTFAYYTALSREIMPQVSTYRRQQILTIAMQHAMKIGYLPRNTFARARKEKK